MQEIAPTRKVLRVARKFLKLPPLPEEQMGIIGPDPEDSRDLIKSAPDGELKPIDLTQKYFKPKAFKIRDQARTNRCAGFAGGSGLHVVSAKLQSLAGRPDITLPDGFSANEVYWHARRNKEKDGGVFMRDLMVALKKHGSVDVRAWPDHHSLYSRPIAVETLGRFKIPGYASINMRNATEGFDTIKRVLSIEELPLFVGTKMFRNVSRNAGYSGFFTLPGSKDKTDGYHAMLCVGWFRREKDGGEYLILVNSWGPRYGAWGFVFIPKEYVLAGFMTNVWTLPDNTY